MKKIFFKIVLLVTVSLIIAIGINCGGMFTRYFVDIVRWCAFFIALWVYIIIFYYIFLSFFGYKKPIRDYPSVAPKINFLILIPAHNEENVIKQTIINIKRINYPGDLFKLVVVSDQSTDKTKQFACQENVTVVDTNLNKHVRKGIGKASALQYAIEDIEYDKYDYIMVLDADNFVDSNILFELNAQLQKFDFDAVQAYLDSKNINTFQSLGYAASYWTMNRFFQLAKYRLGLPNSIGGTGFVISTNWLKKHNGFISKSLTEDLEMQIRIIKTGGTIGWNHFTRIYDEKPEKLKIAMLQRYRWSKGHWFVAFRNYKSLLSLFFRTGKFKYLDQLNYLFSMRQSIQILVCIMFFISALFLQNVFSNPLQANLFFYWSRGYIIPITALNYFVLIYGLLPMLYGIYVDGKVSIKQTIVSILALLYFSLTYLVAQISGLFMWKNQDKWAHTTHIKKYSTRVIVENNYRRKTSCDDYELRQDSKGQLIDVNSNGQKEISISSNLPMVMSTNQASTVNRQKQLPDSVNSNGQKEISISSNLPMVMSTNQASTVNRQKRLPDSVNNNGQKEISISSNLPMVMSTNQASTVNRQKRLPDSVNNNGQKEISISSNLPMVMSTNQASTVNRQKRLLDSVNNNGQKEISISSNLPMVMSTNQASTVNRQKRLPDSVNNNGQKEISISSNFPMIIRHSYLTTRYNDVQQHSEVKNIKVEDDKKNFELVLLLSLIFLRINKG
ncbi:glycosyltransferase family 2 protein [Lactiplantibacillus plantarum]|uniref:glycosyltransferase family 2 protein n=1 Tax=Lactiplantibacillus plantarum TaxID=1590 RepID=UPI003965C335